MDKDVLAVYPGTFDPITLGHEDVVRRATQLFGRVMVAVAAGQDKSTLFSVEERLDMVRESVKEYPQVQVESFAGLLRDFVVERGGKAMVRGLRAGYPVTGALELVVKELPDPLSSELALVLAEMNYGSPLRDALDNLAARVQTQDINMFVVSVAIQTETGGSLADILDSLTRVIRDRASMVMKVRALASEGKMTGTLLTAMPVITFVGVFSSEPQFYLDVVDDPWFMPGTLGVVFMYVLGVVIMRRLIAIKV